MYLYNIYYYYDIIWKIDRAGKRCDYNIILFCCWNVSIIKILLSKSGKVDDNDLWGEIMAYYDIINGPRPSI